MMRAKAEAARAAADERRARAAGSSPGTEIVRRRDRAQTLEKLAAAEIEQVDVLEKLRWAEGEDSPARSKEDPQRIEEEGRRVLKRIAELRAEVLKSSGREAGTGEEPPQDGSGTPLFPADVAG